MRIPDKNLIVAFHPDLLVAQSVRLIGSSLERKVKKTWQEYQALIVICLMKYIRWLTMLVREET